MSLGLQLSHNLSFALKVQGWAQFELCTSDWHLCDERLKTIYNATDSISKHFCLHFATAPKETCIWGSEWGHGLNSYLQGAETLRDAEEGSDSC